MPLNQIVFQRQRKVFLKKHENLLVFPHIYLKASTFTDNRQKCGKKTFLLFTSNTGIHDFVKIRRTFTNFLYLFFNVRYIQSILVTFLNLDSCRCLFFFTRKIYNIYNSTKRTLASVFNEFEGLKKSTRGLTDVFLFLLSPVFLMHLSK